MNETTYQTFDSWKRACKAKAYKLTYPLNNPPLIFDGDKDICQALLDCKPLIEIGEWDGEKGTIFNR